MSYPMLTLRNALVTTTLLVAALCAAFVPATGMAQAAETEAAAEVSPADDTETEPATDKPASKGSNDQPSSEVFIPSEDISEDFAVSFPVDI